jgi:hypothetical protein
MNYPPEFHSVRLLSGECPTIKVDAAKEKNVASFAGIKISCCAERKRDKEIQAISLSLLVFQLNR